MDFRAKGSTAKNLESSKSLVGRRFSVRGRVQGVGFRDFVQREAHRRAITGYTRNLVDGSLLVCAVGSVTAIAELEAILNQGPRGADVHLVEVEEMPAQEFEIFRIVP
ncbi:acylphosphatase [Nevskia soli]|jgi:acylphosphatase|uniref:acylphosphatase n=1 Tax=Nevskia soli TaxID=418856 RepID=UPI0015D74FBD|nr:acylphosphatase [Nevskia soli]